MKSDIRTRKFLIWKNDFLSSAVEVCTKEGGGTAGVKRSKV